MSRKGHQCPDRHAHGFDLFGAAEIRQIDHETGRHHIGADFFQKPGRALRRAAAAPVLTESATAKPRPAKRVVQLIGVGRMGVLHDRKQPHGTAKLNQPINMTAMGAAFGTFGGTLAGVVILMRSLVDLGQGVAQRRAGDAHQA